MPGRSQAAALPFQLTLDLLFPACLTLFQFTFQSTSFTAETRHGTPMAEVMHITIYTINGEVKNKHGLQLVLDSKC